MVANVCGGMKWLRSRHSGVGDARGIDPNGRVGIVGLWRSAASSQKSQIDGLHTIVGGTSGKKPNR